MTRSCPVNLKSVDGNAVRLTALLEGTLGVCVGCRVYALLPRSLTTLRSAA